jgi:hypothetical protein
MRCGSSSDRDAFAAAVTDYRLERVVLDRAELELARAAIDEAGLLLVGEPHGARETPSVLWTLAHELDARALALEWSHDELGEFVEDLDLDRLWSLPETAEAFCGDGRFTAGHLALLQGLRAAGRLEQLILFDRLDPEPAPDDWRPRDAEMAQRLVAEWDGETRLIAVAGAFHTRLDAEDGTTMAMHLARRLPLRPAMLAYSGTSMPAAPIVLRLPPATPADVPTR